MAWYDTLNLIVRSLLRTDAKPKKIDHGANWNSPYGQRPPYDPKKALEAYGKHAWTHATVSRQAQDIAALPLKLITGKGKDEAQIDNHEFLELMEFPNTNTDYYLFVEQLIVDLRLSGNAYILQLGTSDKPTSLVRLHPGEVQITSDETGITGFAYDTGAGQRVVYPVDKVVHLRNAGYKTGPQSLYGTGIVEVLAADIDSDMNSLSLASEASKRGHPSILISPTDPADVWDTNRRKAILDQYQGLAKSGGAMALSGQAQITPLKLSPKDMEFKESRIMARQSVGAVSGTPSTILTLESANYATARQASIAYYQNLQKIGRRLELALTKIARLFDRSLHVKLDYSNVESLQSLRTEQLNRISLHIMNGMTAENAYAYEGLADAPIGQNAVTEEEERIINISEYRNIKAYSDLSDTVKTALKNKATDHNETIDEKNMADWRKVRPQTLGTVFERGVGAFNTNPGSVRPNITSADQWAFARVNSFLYALRNDRFRSGKHDTDLLPEEHELSSKESKKKLLSRCQKNMTT